MRNEGTYGEPEFQKRSKLLKTGSITLVTRVRLTYSTLSKAQLDCNFFPLPASKALYGKGFYFICA
jgi:hypothetical protein